MTEGQDRQQKKQEGKICQDVVLEKEINPCMYSSLPPYPNLFQF